MKKLICSILSVVMVLSLAACGGGGSASPGAAQSPGGANSEAPANTSGTTPTYIFKLSHCMALNSGYQAFSEKFKEIVETETNGDIFIEIYPASQLAGERESNEGAQLGTIEFSYTSAAPLANFAPGFEVYNLPFLFESREQAHAYFDSEYGDARLDSLEQYGLVGLAWAEVDFFNLFLNTPVTGPDDMRGLTIRCLENSLYMGYLSALGANPVPMAWSEVPAALSNGTINGACLGVPGSYDLSMFNGMYYCPANINWGPCPFVMSKLIYDELPAEYQELMHTAAKDAVVYQREWYAEVLEERLEEMIAGGTTVCDLDEEAFMEIAVKPVYDQSIADGLVDPQDIIDVNSFRTTDPLYVPQ